MKKEEIKPFVKEWMEGHEKDTFPLTEKGECMYTKGATTLNLVWYFESLLRDYIDEQNDVVEQNLTTQPIRELNSLKHEFLYSEIVWRFKNSIKDYKNSVIEDVILADDSFLFKLKQNTIFTFVDMSEIEYKKVIKP